VLTLLDKSYELFLETAWEMCNIAVEDINELQTTLLQLNSLIENRASYNLAEDVVQNLQGHLQRTLASTEEFTSATTTTPGAATDVGGGVMTNDNLCNTTTTSSADSTSTTPSDATATTGTTSNTTTTTTALNNADASMITDSGPLLYNRKLEEL
jgi:membrane protease subunit (stomatin/prohibitin family)